MNLLNVGYTDRVLRTLVGVALIGAAAGGIIGPWSYVGIVPLLTGLFARCPVYAILGIATTAR